MSDDHFGAEVAARYDAAAAAMHEPEVLGPAVDLLADLAGDGAALELAIGTGRVALALAARGVRVAGIDLSEAMVEVLRAKDGGHFLVECVVPDLRRLVPGHDAVVFGHSPGYVGYDRSPFTGDSPSHVSVWQRG